MREVVQHRPGAAAAVVAQQLQRRMTVEDFIALQHTYSYVIRASAALQAQLDSELPLIVREHVGPAATVTVPVICQVWRSARR